jgi:hypothetical protein
MKKFVAIILALGLIAGTAISAAGNDPAKSGTSKKAHGCCYGGGKATGAVKVDENCVQKKEACLYQSGKSAGTKTGNEKQTETAQAKSASTCESPSVKSKTSGNPI